MVSQLEMRDIADILFYTITLFFPNHILTHRQTLFMYLLKCFFFKKIPYYYIIFYFNARTRLSDMEAKRLGQQYSVIIVTQISDTLGTYLGQTFTHIGSDSPTFNLSRPLRLFISAVGGTTGLWRGPIRVNRWCGLCGFTEFVRFTLGLCMRVIGWAFLICCTTWTCFHCLIEDNEKKEIDSGDIVI